ncbi:MAG: ABC-type nitrate/sulfonate/bicarbonate transport system, permease component, partial [Nocardioidaceae bacterium]|nr:ABC-type nitrate/sulfonate/bicarbonate transport system, permease component [Nocardioidaceae bacterium]
MRRSLLTSILTQLWLPVLVVAGLWFWSSGSTSFYFPPLQTMLGAMWSGLTDGTLKSDLWFSLKNILLGMAFATVVGVFVGLVIGENDGLRRATAPLLDYVRATPTIAFVPVIVLTFGIGAAPKVFLIFLGSVWPILLNTISGVAGINPAVNETASSYRIPWRLRLVKVTLPGAMPQVFAGVRVALQVAIVLMVVSEIYGSPIGLCNFILQSGSSFRVADTWGGTILIGILGYVLSVALMLLEHLVLGWHYQRAPRVLC